MFENATMGELVEISGADRFLGRWDHHAFVPCPLGDQEPALSGATYRAIAAAGRALAALDASARQLPSPSLLRIPALRREAQSTSALEGAYAPLDEVLTADEDSPATFAVAHPSFTVRRVQEALGLSYGRANSLVGQLVDLGVLQPIDPDAHPRRFTAPRVLRALLSGGLG